MWLPSWDGWSVLFFSAAVAVVAPVQSACVCCAGTLHSIQVTPTIPLVLGSALKNFSDITILNIRYYIILYKNILIYLYYST